MQVHMAYKSTKIMSNFSLLNLVYQTGQLPYKHQQVRRRVISSLEDSIPFHIKK